jgi:hypothetical protein
MSLKTCAMDHKLWAHFHAFWASRRYMTTAPIKGPDERSECQQIREQVRCNMRFSEQEATPFKMFGLQRTGTNLMLSLMKLNFVVYSLERGSEWKHGVVKHPNRIWNGLPARFVLCVKNPYAWLVSCYRYFQKSYRADGTVAPQFRENAAMSFAEFVRGPCYEFESPVHRWNKMYEHWIAFLPSNRTVTIRQDDQLYNQYQVLEHAEKKLALTRKNECLQCINDKVEVGEKVVGTMNHEYYLMKEYLSEYTHELLNQVNSIIDVNLLSHFYYTIEPPPNAIRELCDW